MYQGGIWGKDFFFFLQCVSEHEVIKHEFLSRQKRSQTWLSSMVFCSFFVSWNGASKAQICFWFLLLLLLLIFFFNSISSRCDIKCCLMRHWEENWVGVGPSSAPFDRRRAWSWVCPSVVGLMVTDFKSPFAVFSPPFLIFPPTKNLPRLERKQKRESTATASHPHGAL